MLFATRNILYRDSKLKSKNSDDIGDVAAPLISRTSHPDNFLPVAVVVDAERNFADSDTAEPGFFFGLERWKREPSYNLLR